MKRSKKPSRVSWPSGPKLCQVKMFRTEDCPAKVASQPQRHCYLKQSAIRKPRGPDLPPGFEGNHYADKPPTNVKDIRRIKWKRPRKFLVNDSWRIGVGGESTERQTENFRISKVLEAIYPHRSAIPSRPSVSPVVEAECFDDSKTPTIRLTPIEDECGSAEESSHTSLESGFNPNKPDQLETKLPSSTEEPVSRLAPDLSLAANAALAALMKTNEQGSLVDRDLLIKILNDPKIIKNLIGDKTGKSSETKTQPAIDSKVNPERPTPQHVTASPMARKPQPLISPREQSFATSVPFTNPEQRRVSPPKPGYRNLSPPNPINGNPINIPMPISHVNIAKQPSLPARLPSSSIPMNLNLHRPPHAFSEPKVTLVKPQPHPQPNSAFRTSEMNNIQASIGCIKGPQTGFDTYPMNYNRIDATERPSRPIAQPMRKSVDYFKNLIKEHGTDNHETNQYHSQTGIFNGHDDIGKAQKQCAYFNSPRGCKLGESCMYVHDRFRPEAPMAKRMKFGNGRYAKNGL